MGFCELFLRPEKRTFKLLIAEGTKGLHFVERSRVKESLEVGVPTVVSNMVGVPNALKWTLDFGVGEIFSPFVCVSGTLLAPLENGLGEGSKGDQELLLVQATP